MKNMILAAAAVMTLGLMTTTSASAWTVTSWQTDSVVADAGSSAGNNTTAQGAAVGALTGTATLSGGFAGQTSHAVIDGNNVDVGAAASEASGAAAVAGAADLTNASTATATDVNGGSRAEVDVERSHSWGN